MEILIGIVWIVLAFLVASSAKNRGKSYGLFLALSLLFSPLLGFIILLIVGDR